MPASPRFTDELLRRFRHLLGPSLRIAVIAIDPSKRKTGGALLGDRIRMNAIQTPNVYFRSMSTRGAVGEVPEMLADMIAACKVAGYDLVIVETPGIGQGDAGIVPYSDVSLYVMTPEFGAASQLEKDRHAGFRRRGRDQQVRPQGRGSTRCATSRSSISAITSSSPRRPTPCRSTAPSPRVLPTRA